ncbi:MAG: MFS transporter [Pseudomonadota bacterium]
MKDLRVILIAIVPLLFSALLMVAANGLLGTLLSVRMNLEQFAVGDIGIIMAGYAVGFVLGARFGPVMVARVGHIRSFAAFAATGAATALIHPIFVGEILWGLLRISTGFSMACMLAIIESWLNAKAPNNRRGLLLSIYMVVNFTALAGSQPMLTITSPAGYELFSLVAILFALSLVPLSASRIEAPPPISTQRLKLVEVIRISPLGVAGCFAAGLVNSAFNSLGPLYAQAIHPSAEWIGFFMLTAVLGGLVLQVPMGRLSDYFDRRKVILGLATTQIVVTACVILFGAIDDAILLGMLAVFGGLAYTLYPISLSHANDFMQPHQLLLASASLLLCFGVGAAIGPIVAGQIMNQIGTWGLFAYIAAIGVLLTGFTLWRMTKRATLPNEDQGNFVAIFQTSPVANELDPRYEPDQTEPETGLEEGQTG